MLACDELDDSRPRVGRSVSRSQAPFNPPWKRRRWRNAPVRPWPDGKRFVGVIDVDAGSRTANTPQIRVVENWFEDLKARVPTK